MYRTEMGAISDGLATFIDYIAEHVSPRIAGRWDVQGAWCNRYRVESQIKHILIRRCAGVSTRAFANHFFSRLRFVGLGRWTTVLKLYVRYIHTYIHTCVHTLHVGMYMYLMK